MSRWRRQLNRRHNEARAIADTIGWAFEACNECGAKANSYHYAGCPFAPFVCPGCYALNDEPCAGYCPDAALRRKREERLFNEGHERELYLEEHDDFSV